MSTETSQSISETKDGIELHELRMQLAQLDDRLSTLKAEAETLLRRREPIQTRIAQLEDRK